MPAAASLGATDVDTDDINPAAIAGAAIGAANRNPRNDRRFMLARWNDLGREPLIRPTSPASTLDISEWSREKSQDNIEVVRTDGNRRGFGT